MAKYHPPTTCPSCGKVVERISPERKPWQPLLIGDNTYLNWDNHKCKKKDVKKMEKIKERLNEV